MRLTNILIQKSNRLLRNIVSKLPFPEIEKPTFIIGTGRSGTTILGTALSHHSKITYLNEPRHIWIQFYPITDIWSKKAMERGGKMALSANEIDPIKSKKLRKAFYLKTLKNFSPYLVEKLPINCFRLHFIKSIFPDAQFIYLKRNGLEVAKSIQKKSENGAWFGKNDYKWQQLVDFAQSQESTKNIPDYCSSYHEKGLLEWRLGNEAVVSFLKTSSKDNYIEISYDQLVDNPKETIEEIFTFMGLDFEKKIEEFSSNNIQRRSGKLGDEKLTEKEEFIGGPLLKKSLDPEHKFT